MIKSTIIRTLYLFFLTFTNINLLLLLLELTPIDAAHARKRPTAKVKSNTNKYDRQITTFDPNGHLLQVEYAHECTKRGNTGAFVNYNDEVIIAVIKRKNGGRSIRSDGANNADDNGIRSAYIRRNSGGPSSTGMHRISDGIFCKMTGLEGDGRLLSRHLQSTAHQLAWTEGVLSSPPSSASSSSSGITPLVYVNQIAKLCGEVQHSLTIQNGARPLGVDVVLMGKINSSNLGLFHCTVGGIVNQCEFCASGVDSNLVLKGLDSCINELKNNQEVVQVSEGSDPQRKQTTKGEKEEMKNKNVTVLPIPKLVKDVAKIVFKPMQSSRNYEVDENDINDHNMPSDTVDIYIILLNPKCRGGIQTSCALSVEENDLDNVALLFHEEINGM